MRYEIQTLFANGDWRNTTDETFGTLYDAETELIEFTADCEQMVILDRMEDFNAADWRVRECEYEEYEGEEC